MPSLPPKSPLFDTILIVGIGLIGGSVARGVRGRGIARRIIGAGRNRESLEAARAAGVIDEFALTPDDVDIGEQGVDLLLICTPVDHVVGDVRRWGTIVGSAGIITDAGSTKRTICEALGTFPVASDGASGSNSHATSGPVFIGSHPLAGSEKQGWANSDGGLFAGRRCILTPGADAPVAAVDAVITFWKLLGMTTEVMSPAAHDRLLAVTSHLPHATAAALSMLLIEETARMAATGFRSTARVAGGDATVWTPIFLENADAVLAAIEQFQSTLSTLADAIRSGDAAAITTYLAEARDRYQQLGSVE